MRRPNMRDVVEDIIKPKTAKRQVSYAETLEQNKVRYFVSHSWSSEFKNFVEALVHFAKAIGEEDPAFWICALLCRMWNVGFPRVQLPHLVVSVVAPVEA